MCKWGLGTRENDVLQTKNGEGHLTAHEIPLYSPRKITSMVYFLIKTPKILHIVSS